MKADVHPPLPQLDIPPWVPDAIARHVGASYAADVDRVYEAAFRESGYFEHEHEYDVSREYRDQLIRDDVPLRERIADLVRDELVDKLARYLPLVTDYRMKGVWRELSRHGSDGAFLHPAIGIEQDAAMIQLFDTAFACQQRRGATTTQRKVDQQRDRCLVKAEELRDDAIEMMLQSPLDQRHERYQHLLAAAQAYEDFASEIYAASQPMALQRKHDGQARWVAITIGNTFRALFGKPMYGLTTTITSVVLAREIEPRTVQQWLQTTV